MGADSLMTTLQLGVLDIPYSDNPEEGSKDVSTTGDVAEILEGKYHLFTAFYVEHENDINKALMDGFEDALESMLMGAPADADPFAAGCQKIDQEFRTFLMKAEIEKMGIDGVPTKAALDGKSIRFKRKKGPRRPSFIDSGLLEASFRSWVTE